MMLLESKLNSIIEFLLPEGVYVLFSVLSPENKMIFYSVTPVSGRPVAAGQAGGETRMQRL